MNLLLVLQKGMAFLLSALYAAPTQTTDPPKIQGYVFVKRSHQASPYSLGVYKNKQGKPVFIKAAQSHWYNLYYHNLLFEARILKQSCGITFRGQTVSFPQLVETRSENGYFIVVTRFISGKDLSNFPLTQQLQKYKEVVTFLQKQKLPGVPKKNGIFFLAVLPFIFLLALVKHPTDRSAIVRAFGYIVKNYAEFLARHRLILTHADLHMENIKVYKRQLALFDLAQMMYTFAEYEVITTLSSTRNSNQFNELLLRHLLTVNGSLRRFTSLLLMYCSLHNLTSTAEPKKLRRYRQLLDLGIATYKRSEQKPVVEIGVKGNPL